MGNAKFWFYPEPDGRHLVEIDMGEALGELSSNFFHDVIDGITYSGGISRSVGRGGEVVTIQRDRMQLGEELAHKFDALQNHLDRGYSVAFTADSSKAWAASCQTSPTAGSFNLLLKNNPFEALTGTSTIPSANDYVVLETGSPAYMREVVEVSSRSLTSASGGNITTQSRINFDYNTRQTFARWYRFWPILKRSQNDVGRAIITNEGGRLWSLNVTLVPDYQALFAFFNGEFYQHTNFALTPSSPTSGALPSSSGQQSLDQVSAGAVAGNGGVEDVLSNINMGVFNALRGG
tara:strand:+ start:4772 stop:5647 length:876 start_codon:yes stop_codon:yes gene_type:complete